MMLRFTLLAFYLIVWFNSQGKPLFDEKNALDLVLITDVQALITNTDVEPEYQNALVYQVLSGKEVKQFEIKVKPRGGTRRFSGLCEFPPLKFNFKKNAVQGTVFEGQDKLKFVGQCRQDEKYENYLLEEYLIYKSYNLLTEESYKVRLVNLTIKDVKKSTQTIRLSGFFIEDDKTFTPRTGANRYDEPVYSMDSCTSESADRLALFQFMIGNTDWYVKTKHNIDVYQYPDGSLIPVPYDFDFAGIINTEYAKPSSQIPINSVTERYFKGQCKPIEALDSGILLFAQNKERIYSLYNNFEELPKYVKKKSIRYQKEFFDLLHDPSLIEENHPTQCELNLSKAPKEIN